MPKPSGIEFIGPGMRVIKHEPWKDTLWDAVQEAQDADVIVHDFIAEMKSSWIQAMNDEVKRAERELRNA